MNKLILSIATTLFLTGLASCAENKKDPSAEKPIHPKHKGPVLKWVELSHRDTLNMGDSVEFVYPFVNDGWGDVRLKEVENDGLYCEAQWTKDNVRIFDTARITFRCHFGEPGFVAQAFHVKYEDEKGAEGPPTALTYYVVVRDAKGNLPTPSESSPRKKLGQ